MSKKQWGHGYHTGRFHEKLNQAALSEFPKFLDHFFGKDKWLFDENEDVYIVVDPKHKGPGIALMVITKPEFGELSWETLPIIRRYNDSESTH